MHGGKKTTIYLIRHGECAGNKEKRIRGHMDFPLNDNGIRQAQALAGALRDKGIQHIYSSPLIRAMKTSEILADAIGCSYEACDGFNNICIGVWENRIKAELAKEVPEMWHTWLTNPEELRIEGGETLDEVKDRSLEALKQVITRHCGQTIAVVSHRGVLKPMTSGALGIARPRYWRLHFDTAAYSILTYDDVHGFCLMGLNYSEHLKGIPIIQEFD